MNLNQAIIENIPDAVFIIDSSHRIVFANSAVKEYIGREPGEILNKYCYNVLTSDLCFKGCPFNYVVESRASFTRYGVRVYDDGGNARQVSYSAFPYRNEVVDGIAITMRSNEISPEVAETIKAEQNVLPFKKHFFKELLDEVHDGVVLVDRNFRIVEFNKQAEMMTGFRKEELYGQPCPNVCVFSEDYACPFDYCIKTGTFEQEAYTTINRKHGDPVVVKIRVKLIHDDEHDLIGGMAILKDLGVGRKGAAGSEGFAGITGASKPMQNVFHFVKAASLTKLPVLVSGENGVGKGIVAAAIHRLTSNQDAPFVKLNCSGVASDILDRELFGADGEPGKLAQAADGTLFLNEIAETTDTFQSRLLELIEKNGNNIPQVRFIATTKRDLRKEMAEGRFREDLFYRLTALHIAVPPLRERSDDIPALLRRFMSDLAVSNEAGTLQTAMLTESAIEYLKAYNWPGNVLELKNTVGQIYFTAPVYKKSLSHGDLPEHIREFVKQRADEKGNAQERERIINALIAHNLDKTRTAQSLGISRVTLWRKLVYHDIKVDELIR